MILRELSKIAVEEAIKQNLKAIIYDIPKYKCLVGIPAGKENTASKKKYNKLRIDDVRALDYQVWKKYRKYNPPMKMAITNEMIRRNNQEPVDIAYYASQNEFGSYSDHIPARPFLRTTFEGDKLEKINKKAQQFLNECAENNRGAEDYLNKIGLYAAGLVQENITKGDFTPNPPNSPLTIAIKGSSKPLIDTGTMRRALTSWTVKR